MDREEVLGECERLWTNERDIAGVLAAVKLCAENGWILPEWCKQPVMDGLDLLAKKSGRGRSQSLLSRKKMASLHRKRHNLVRFYRKQGMTLEQAFAQVAEGEGMITADAVEKSYYSIAASRAK